MRAAVATAAATATATTSSRPWVLRRENGGSSFLSWAGREGVGVVGRGWRKAWPWPGVESKEGTNNVAQRCARKVAFVVSKFGTNVE